MTLRSKILVGYTAIVALMGFMVALTVSDYRLLGGATEEILRENYRSILAADAMIKHLERQDSATLLLLVEGREAAQRQFQENQQEFLRWLTRAEDNVTIDGEQAILDEIQTSYAEYVAEFVRESSVAADPQAGQALYRDQLLPLFQRVREAATRLRHLNHETMVTESARTRLLSRESLRRVAVLAALTVLAGLLLSVMLANLLTRPLREMMDATSKLATGDYDVTLTTESSDELGELARRISTMSAKLKGFHEINVGRLIEERTRLDAVLRSIGDGVIVTDERLSVAMLNPCAAEIFSAWPDHVRGRPASELIHDDDLIGALKAAARGTEPAGGTSQLHLSVPADAASSEEARHFRCVVTPVVTERGATLGAVLVLQDMTQLLETDRLKNEFIMAASHELRTPLTGIVMSLKLLEEHLGASMEQDNRELLRTANEEAHRLRALVEDLLDLSKLSSGRLELDRVRTSVADVVAPAVGSIRTQLAAKGVALEVDLPTSLPDIVTDPSKLTWVLANLLSNAMRYTEAGGCVRITARAGSDDVQISVSDTGAGIPVEIQGRVFDPFVQAHVPGFAPGGLGIGLSLARSIVRAQGGTIWVESRPGAGATFTFTAPRWSRQGTTGTEGRA